MKAVDRIPRAGSRPAQRGYLIVLFVVIVAFVAVVAAMQVLVLTSVATTSRAYDSYRQGATELSRLEHAVAETLLDQRQVSVVTASTTLADALGRHLADLCPAGANVTVSALPATLPAVNSFPSPTSLPDALGPLPADLQPYLTPELAVMAGPRVASYPEMTFTFSSQRTVLEASRTYATEVRARLIAVPLSRFPVAAYELPADIGSMGGLTTPGPDSALPAGLVPARDPAFRPELQAQGGTLPYHYRRRAALSAAYQYLFSQGFIDRVAEYAGITHFCGLDATGGTAVLNGMTTTGASTSWDLGVAGRGTYNTIALDSNATVVFAETGGRTLRLHDSVGSVSADAMFLLILGPSDLSRGPLVLELSSIARPLVVVACNVRVTAVSGTAVNGALFLDPASVLAPAGAITLGHLSYWAGTNQVAVNAVVATGAVPIAAEALVPRVVYAAARALRL